jgi:hypothetical protein
VRPLANIRRADAEHRPFEFRLAEELDRCRRLFGIAEGVADILDAARDTDAAPQMAGLGVLTP